MPHIARRVHDVVLDECRLGPTALGLTDDLTAEHGIDDLDLMKIAMRLEEVFGVEINDDDLQRERTISNCVTLVREQLLAA